MLTCSRCGQSGHAEDFDLHPDGIGFWCECNAFTFFDPEEHNKRRLLLLLEDKQSSADSIQAPTTIRLRKQLSPLRYPGGKSKIIDYLYSRLCHDQLDTFTEVFAGGASLGLSLLDAGAIKHLILNDKDPGVYAFWKTVLNWPQELTSRLQSVVPTRHDLTQAKKLLSLASAPVPVLAWSFLLANRLSYSGIVKANPLGGKNGSQEALLSRWNPKKLEERIMHIHSMRGSIELHNEDCFDFISETAWWTAGGSTLFCDPPYFTMGEKLYTTFFTEEDHARLAWLLQDLHTEFPSADIIVTYDNHPRIRELYPDAQQEIIPRRYSI